MQDYYEHSVAPDTRNSGNSDGRRLAIVFRDGKKVYQVKDSGAEYKDLSPRQRHPINFGRNSDRLLEGALDRRK